MKKLFFFIILSFIELINLKANNLQIGVPTVDEGASTISFTIQWDNSWFITTGPSNWDAVWIFIKRQSCIDNNWNHALISTVSAEHSVTGGVLQVDAVVDGMGVFVHRSLEGIGNIALSTVTLRMQDVLNLQDNFQIFAIEMIYIPQGDFYIGDGTRGFLNYGFSAADPYPPILITAAIQTAGIGAAINYQVDGLGSTGDLPSTFPLGWNSFYCMKYEISQEQYATFLNSLTYDQQITRTANPPNSATGTLAIADALECRNGIKIETSGVVNNVPAVYSCDLNGNGTFNEVDDGQNIACNWLSWPDLIAYLDWSALRPMTEFEFEKICRGPLYPVAGEYAWGTTALLQAQSGELNNAGLASETSILVGAGLCAYGINNTDNGPLRCGFAATATTTRAFSGGSYYGVMDMSGNVAEQCVGGRLCDYSTFTTANGNGNLSTPAGIADVIGWPSIGGGTWGGGISRGGDWHDFDGLLDISGRFRTIINDNQDRDYRFGGRGVRSW